MQSAVQSLGLLFSPAKRLLAAALAAICLTNCASSSRLKVGKTAQGEVVEAEGSCPVISGNIKDAKSCSLAEAQRQALEKVVGLYISAKTRVEKAVAIEQNILAKSEGYISKYDILKQKQEGEFYKTKIRALVPFNQIGSDLRTLEILKAPAVGNPRIAVLVTDLPSDDSSPAKTDENTELMAHTSNGISEVLIAGGFRLVDPEAKAAAGVYEHLDDLEKGDSKILKDLGEKLNAEIVIYGESRVSPVTLEGMSLGGMKSYRATLSAKAARAHTGEVLQTISAQASGLEATKDAAIQKALESVGRKAGNDLVRGLSQRLLKEAVLEITAQNVIDLEKLNQLKKTLSDMAGIHEIYLRSFGNSEAVIDVHLSKSGQVGIEEVSQTLTQKLGAKIKNLEGNTLTISL